ncbi:MAG: ribonuclease Z [Bacteroidota bacterium]
MTFTLTVLGSSSALPTSERFTSAHVLNVHEHLFLIDCGEGTQIQLRKYKIKFSKIDNIFISHTHGDHILGLIGLISSFDLLGRKHPLNIYSPGKLDSIINSQLVFFDDHLNFEIIFHKVDHLVPNLIFENKQVEIYSVPLKHRIPTTGYVFKEKPALPNIKKDKIEKYNIPLKRIFPIKCGEDFTTEKGEVIPNDELVTHSSRPRSYAYCSDTMYSEDIVPQITGVSLLYHEATFMNELSERAKETFHSSTYDAANIAKIACAEKLLIGHFSVRYKDITPMLDEAKSIFENTIAAEDGMIIDI